MSLLYTPFPSHAPLLRFESHQSRTENLRAFIAVSNRKQGGAGDAVCFPLVFGATASPGTEYLQTEVAAG